MPDKCKHLIELVGELEHWSNSLLNEWGVVDSSWQDARSDNSGYRDMSSDVLQLIGDYRPLVFEELHSTSNASIADIASRRLQSIEEDITSFDKCFWTNHSGHVGKRMRMSSEFARKWPSAPPLAALAIEEGDLRKGIRTILLDPDRIEHPEYGTLDIAGDTPERYLCDYADIKLELEADGVELVQEVRRKLAENLEVLKQLSMAREPHNSSPKPSSASPIAPTGMTQAEAVVAGREFVKQRNRGCWPGLKKLALFVGCDSRTLRKGMKNNADPSASKYLKAREAEFDHNKGRKSRSVRTLGTGGPQIEIACEDEPWAELIAEQEKERRREDGYSHRVDD